AGRGSMVRRACLQSCPRTAVAVICCPPERGPPAVAGLRANQLLDDRTSCVAHGTGVPTFAVHTLTVRCARQPAGTPFVRRRAGGGSLEIIDGSKSMADKGWHEYGRRSHLRPVGWRCRPYG